MFATKMRGIADPYTLGMIIAVLGALTANWLHDDSQAASSGLQVHESSVQLVLQASDVQDKFGE